MKTIGTITKINEGKGFFFIDNDYICYYDKVDFTPRIAESVEYERSTNSKGKPLAKNVKTLGTVKSSPKENFFDKYIGELNNGYFSEKDYLKIEFSLEYARELAKIFSVNKSINKPTQIRKYFDYCDGINGVFKVNKDFRYVMAELPKIISYVSNALSKNLISNDFYDFIEKNIDIAIKDSASFSKGFIPHFEAVIGFFPKK